MVVQVNDYKASDQQIDDYLKQGDVRIAHLDPATFKRMVIPKTNQVRIYHNILSDLDDIDRWLSLVPQNIEQCYGLFCMTKWALIGSDMHQNGLLAPLQWQLKGDGLSDQQWDSHPGGDRAFMLESMPHMWPVPVMFDFKPWMYVPELEYERIDNIHKLKEYFKNWDTSLPFIVPYDCTQRKDDHQAFMRVVMHNFLSAYRNLKQPANMQGPQQRLEIKNSKKLFIDICNRKQQLLDTIKVNTYSVQVGPWTLTNEGELIWNSDQVWSL